MKKLGLGLIGVVLVAAIYYITSGASQLTTQIKTQIDTELATLQTHGISVEGREIAAQKEHFVLTFNEAEKFTPFLNSYGTQLKLEDAKVLEGFKLGVDVAYLNDMYSAATFDMYPVALPAKLRSADLEEKEKKILAQFQKMLQDKVFLLHFSINKLGTGFKGYMKDIDEAFIGESTVNFAMKGFTFTGDITDEKVTGLKQTLKSLNIYMKDELTMHLTDLTGDYHENAKNKYISSADYSVKEMGIDIPTEFTLRIKALKTSNTSTVKDDLVAGTLKSSIQNIDINNHGEKLTLDDLHFDMSAHNIDMKALTEIETVDVNDEAKLNALLQQLISKGLRLEIPTMDIKTIHYADKKMDGFALNAGIVIDPSLNIQNIAQNPMGALQAIDANLTLSLSTELFTLISQQPQAMMALMIFPAKEEKNKKVYQVELKSGTLKVNNQPVM